MIDRKRIVKSIILLHTESKITDFMDDNKLNSV